MTVIIRGKISEVLLLRLITNINCSQSMLYQIKLKVNAERRCRNFFFVNFITLLVLLLYLNAIPGCNTQYPTHTVATSIFVHSCHIYPQ
jgi:hypothetical protein